MHFNPIEEKREKCASVDKKVFIQPPAGSPTLIFPSVQVGSIAFRWAHKEEIKRCEGIRMRREHLNLIALQKSEIVIIFIYSSTLRFLIRATIV